MRQLFRLERIGDNWQAYRRASECDESRPLPIRDIINIERYGSRRLASWVARIYPGFRREFLRGNVDFSSADDLGERGIYCIYALEPGVYEVNECRALGRAQRYFLRVTEAIAKISRDEAAEWLSDHSA